MANQENQPSEERASWTGDEPSESAMQLKLGWLRMVAKCWRDPGYTEKVLGMDPAQVRNEFSSAYDVTLPADLSVKITQDPKKDLWDPDMKRWRYGTSAELTLFLPNPPQPSPGQPPHSDDAIALAEYEWNGRKYPFSCCC
jgi:hypothetical protein